MQHSVWQMKLGHDNMVQHMQYYSWVGSYGGLRPRPRWRLPERVDSLLVECFFCVRFSSKPYVVSSKTEAEVGLLH